MGTQTVPRALRAAPQPLPMAGVWRLSNHRSLRELPGRQPPPMARIVGGALRASTLPSLGRHRPPRADGPR
eukprot:2641433-Alexandrium_andersonii.AAC.1